MKDKKVSDITIAELVTITELINEYSILLQNAHEQLEKTRQLIEDNIHIITHITNENKKYSQNNYAQMKELIDKIDLLKSQINTQIEYETKMKHIAEHILNTNNKVLSELSEQIHNTLQDTVKQIEVNMQKQSDIFLNKNMFTQISNFLKRNTAITLAIVTFFIASMFVTILQSCNMQKDITQIKQTIIQQQRR